MRPPERIRLVLSGGSLDTANLGVCALGLAVAGRLLRWSPRLHLTHLDHSRGLRRHAIDSNGSVQFIDLCGARLTRRLYQPEALGRVRLAARLGGLRNPAAQRILSADALLDISGGDSFTDLYGLWRFRAVTMPKLIALENNIPLILLPQTYGPFNAPKSRHIAQRIVCGAAMAWARDGRSFEVLRDLLGDAFDPGRHRLGVDVAFALKAHDPGDRLSLDLRGRLSTDNSERPVGVNISGLMYHDPERTRNHYGFVADYRELITYLLTGLLERTDAPILLVPHVLTPAGNYESDPEACRLARETLPLGLRKQVHLVPPDFDASEMKWIISRCQWFNGTRMHATIAGLSTGVPTTAIAYSPKTQGVFETCGLGHAVVDPRECDTDTCVERLLELFDLRDELASTVADHLPGVKAQADRQINEIVERVVAMNTQRTKMTAD